MAEGQNDQARGHIMQVLALARARGLALVIVGALHLLATIALRQGALDEAETLLTESIMQWRRIGGDPSGLLAELAWVLLRRGGQSARAAALLAEALPLSRAHQAQPALVACLSGLASVAVEAGDAARAARLVGAAEAWREAHGVPVPRVQRVANERTMATARDHLGAATAAAAWAAGAAVPIDTAIAEAVSVAAGLPADAAAGPVVTAPSRAAGHPDGLTAREVEVLRLIAAGKSSRAIAETLVISESTVERHVSNLYAKIGAHSRADATAYAFRHALTMPTDG